MTETVLDIQNVTSGYVKDVPVVQEFSLEVKRAEVTLVVGPNGAGKSTLLRTIYGMTSLIAGRIMLGETEIQMMQPWERYGIGIGFIVQGRSNFPYMNVEENLELGTYRLTRKKAKAAIERVCDLFPILKERWTVLAGNLSGGEQQILELAMGLEGEPKLLMIDEPSLGLSPTWQKDVFGAIKKVSEMGITILIVEQNVRAGLAISDVTVVMEHGKKSLQMPSEQILQDDGLRKAYLGSGAEGASPGLRESLLDRDRPDW